jgi:DNA-binding transcriptional LysR family regulator
MLYQYGLELRHLATFCAVAETLHFRGAADRLHIAQPAVTRQIQQLEAALGVGLFDRDTRSVALTPAGEAFYPKAVAVLADVERGMRVAKDVATGVTGRIRIGFSGPAMVSALPKLLRGYRVEHARVRLEIEELPTTEQLTRLASGTLDVAFFLDTATPEAIDTVEVAREPGCVGIHLDHPLATREAVALHELADERFILFPRERNPRLYDDIVYHASLGSERPLDIVAASSRQVAAGMVAAGLGVSTFAASMQGMCGPDVRLIPRTDPPHDVVLTMGWKTGAGNPFLEQLPVSSGG